MLACISPIWALRQIEHTQPGLTDTATDRQGQRISHQAFVEIEFQAFFFTFLLELTLEASLSTRIPIEDNSTLR